MEINRPLSLLNSLYLSILDYLFPKKKKKSCVATPYLNDDILFDILTRIPADLLQARFKYLSRQCYNIISSPCFISAHAFRAEYGFLHLYWTEDGHIMRFIINPNSGGLEDEKIQTLVRLPETERPIQSYCPCNGLILCDDGTDVLYITNPVTEETITVPSAKCYHGAYSREFIDLVFVPSTNAYKLVELLREPKTGSLAFRIQVLGARSGNSWRQINVSIFNAVIVGPHDLFKQIAINGVLYVRNIFSCRKMELLSFNVGDERTMDVVPFPTENYGCASMYFPKLVEMGGFLALVTQIIKNGGMYAYDVWILKDAERKEWVKQYSFEAQNYLAMLGSWNNGFAIVFQLGVDRVFIYLVLTRKWKEVQYVNGGRPHFALHSCRPHLNTLVSPNILR